MTLSPTIEQQAVIDAAVSRDNLVVQAGAGTGKTSTLEMVSRQLPEASLYVAYNKSTATDASERFLPYVECRTQHSLAFRAVGRRFSRRINGARRPSWEIAKELDLGPLQLKDGDDSPVIEVSANHQVRIAAETVRRFCHSAAPEITTNHVPFENGITGRNHNILASEILPLARLWWEDANDVHGTLPFDHDYYLKMWALTNPRLPYDVIYLDEAQDTNPMLADLIQNQDHAQQIVVGDGCQQMYAWRGAVDALEGWPDAETLYLSQSWRFGDAIAHEANKWLSQLPTPLRLMGHPDTASVIEPLETPDAILCRTNAGALEAVFYGLQAGQKVALVGGGQQLAKLAQAAGDLKRGKRSSHPELYAFPDWESVVQYAHEASGSDLLPMVNLIEKYGVERIVAATNSLTAEESRADVVVSTVHKAKGREWHSVKVANDFFAPSVADGGEATISSGEAMVGYVAVTRARYILDRSGLAWIDELTFAEDAVE